MTKNAPRETQRIVPYIFYSDAPAALSFLSNAFGFEEHFRFPMPDGRIGHAEIGYDDNVVMLASAFGEIGLASPRDLPALHGQIMCYVDDVDAHHVRARAAGEPKNDHGQLSYRAIDPEGHRWIFATPLKSAAR